ncbi:VOC family protein [Aquimarina algiphila]|uniref:VOC family protein n=1 Tax=Aquimarina algiphila TaxID=2047982 RepID=UPI002330E632|nr:VOC family protein [Aquimarina algiphila]
MNTIFHLAFKVKDISSTKQFYNKILGCPLGRETTDWVDFDFFGHQISAHVSDTIPPLDYCGVVDKIKVPIPHFGCILQEDQFDILKQKLKANNVDFMIPPQTRYAAQTGEQKTMFVLDFSNNPIEFKCFIKKVEVFK